MLLKIGSASVSQNWFHKYYSKFIPQVLLEIDPQTLLKISFTNVTPNRPTNVTQNWFHQCYSKYKHKLYSKLVLRVLLKIGFTNIIQT